MVASTLRMTATRFLAPLPKIVKDALIVMVTAGLMQVIFSRMSPVSTQIMT